MDPQVKVNSFFIEVKDDEMVGLQAAINARLHWLHDASVNPKNSTETRMIYRNAFTKLYLLKSRLFIAFTDPSNRA